ncbi:MAG: sigma-70 family RNA polymerase sigma factor [Parafilimonas sp.]
MKDKPCFILDNERELISECISGNRIMQNTLYAQFASVMIVVCFRYAKSRSDAEEILQEGFIKVFTCLHQYKFIGSLEGWIKKIMINCALQRLRSKNLMYPIVHSETAAEEFADKDGILDDITAKELILLIQNLPNMCRLVFNLYVFESMKHREIAKLLNISEGTSKSNLHDARILLQQRLSEQNSFINLNSGA